MLTLLPFLNSAKADEARNSRPSIGLALGAGGASGLAHISMLQTFDELEIKPDRIAGTSIGAVIGALYTAGLTAEEIRTIFDEFGGSRLDVLSELLKPSSALTLRDLIKIDLQNGGLFDADGFLDFLAEKIEARTFDDLEIPLEVVATDFWSGQTVVFNQGDLFDAIKASIAVPGLFSPVHKGNYLLIDGGTSNPLPYDLLLDHCEVTIAIDVTGTRAPSKENQHELTYLSLKTFEIMQQSITSAKMRYSQPNIYIKPAFDSDIRLLEFNKVEAVLEQAAPAARRLREELIKIIPE